MFIEIITAGATLILAFAAWYSALQSKKSSDAIQHSRYDEFRPFLVPQDGGQRKCRRIRICGETLRNLNGYPL
jgi:hypothetical protein